MIARVIAMVAPARQPADDAVPVHDQRHAVIADTRCVFGIGQHSVFDGRLRAHQKPGQHLGRVVCDYDDLGASGLDIRSIALQTMELADALGAPRPVQEVDERALLA